MIVNTGKTSLLSQQLIFLSTCYWGLFSNNFTIAPGTILSNLTPAAWSGYAPIAAGTWGTPAIVSNIAVTLPAANPTFSNSSGSSQTIFGWYLMDSSQTILIAAVNVGSTAIPNGGTYPLSAALTDNQL